MNILMDVAVKQGFPFPWAFTLLYVVGFIAAVIGGSIAWYNSKRPPGWEGTERPSIIPKVGNDDESES
ncbi:MAG TPA: hypothetical protein IGS17_08060 [Oscillatoriales cyanobacterium M59_W2019_021]|nr:MAG: hypothetical protein D6728_03170 [Cyanobacteria bacterium J055]HIK30969.1 hypothetical protein [Oscillatoriales cyanobacterium M4454_W2019_049]HIK50861.1 hypothetical protein [Oscillatoriales cyanobacterium M59_W2019_021]